MELKQQSGRKEERRAICRCYKHNITETVGKSSRPVYGNRKLCLESPLDGSRRQRIFPRGARSPCMPGGRNAPQGNIQSYSDFVLAMTEQIENNLPFAGFPLLCLARAMVVVARAALDHAASDFLV